MIKRYNKGIVVFLLLGLILLTVRRHYVKYDVHKSIEDAVFNGTVEGITEGSRGVPIFILERNRVSLGGYGHNLEPHLEAGDSIYKLQGSSHVTIITYYFKDTIVVDVLDIFNPIVETTE